MSLRINGKKIIWLAVTPTPYNNYLFSKFHDYYGNRFDVYFAISGKRDAPWSELEDNDKWKYYQKGCFIEWGLLRKILKSKNSLIIFSGWNDPTKKVLLILLALFKRKYFIWTDTPRNGKKIKYFIRNKLLYPVFMRASAVMGTGKMALDVLEKMGVSTNKLVNFPYWIKLPENSHSRISINRGKFKFICVGRLLKYKGFDKAIMALALLKESKAGLTIIGTGPEEEYLKQLCIDVGVSERVNFTGWLEYGEIQWYLANKCDCLIHPAVSLEPYGVVIIEAMAHGIPAIVSECCGAAIDRILHRENGFILSYPVSQKELSLYMEIIIKNNELRYCLGEASRKTANNWPVSRGIKIIDELLKNE